MDKKNVKRYEYGNIHIQTADIVKDTFYPATDRDVKKTTSDERDTYIIVVVMTQYSLKKGLSVLGAPAEEAVVKELQQMKDMDVFSPVDPTTLTDDQ